VKGFVHTEQSDSVIREAYRHMTFGRAKGRLTLDQVAARLGCGRRTVESRARALGVVRPRAEVRLSEPEVEIIKRYAHLSVTALRKRLEKAGFRRSRGQIMACRARELGPVAEIREDRDRYSARQLAQCLGVHGNTVLRWIKWGWLQAERVERDWAGSPIDHQWLVRAKDARQFVIDYTAHVDFSRADKYWLVGLLTGQWGAKKAGSE
jgi:hypothetical protein